MRTTIMTMLFALMTACGGGGSGADSGPGDGDGGGGGADADPVPTAGTLVLTLTADQGAAADQVVSLGVPFPPGALTDATRIRVLDSGGDPVAAHIASLATWPLDDSHRAVLVAFRATLATAATETWSIEYGGEAGPAAGTLAANPDGPVAALLEPAWYAQSRVIGFQVPAADNTAFPDWETEIEDYLAGMSPAWDTYGISCTNTSAERTYYDGPHALYQRFIHRGTPATYRRARAEAVWYRANEIDWYDGDQVALYACAAGWDAGDPLDWGHIRRMLGQAMLDDFLLTGDPEARRVLVGLGEAFRRNLPALTTGGEITVEVTERNMAWPMMGLASYYAVDHRTEVRDALATLVDLTIAWQAEGTSGAFEHDIMRPDPDECEVGPNGGSPFMTSLLVDGLMDAFVLLDDQRLRDVIVDVAVWYRDDARTSDGTAFMYLWNCTTLPSGGDPYDDGGFADLNLLISHVFGAAHYMSGDEAWLDFGDTMANHGIDNIYAGAPKQWSQSTRTFLKYLGYRARARTP